MNQPNGGLPVPADELIVPPSSLYHIPAYRAMSGPWSSPAYTVAKITQQILDESTIPYIRIEKSTAEAFLAWKEDVAKISAEDQGKAQLDQGECGEGYRFRSNRTPCFRRRRPHLAPFTPPAPPQAHRRSAATPRGPLSSPAHGIIANLSPAGFFAVGLLAAGATIWLVLNNLGVCS